MIFYVDSGEQLRDDIDPDFQIDLLEALSQQLLDLGQITVLEPNLEQAQSGLQCSGLGGCRDLSRQAKLLDKASTSTNNVLDVLLNDLRLHVIVHAEVRLCLPQLGQPIVTELTMQQIMLLIGRLLAILARYYRNALLVLLGKAL